MTKSYFLQANDALRHKQYAQAVALFDLALQQTPELKDVLHASRALAMRLGKLKTESAAPSRAIVPRRTAVVVHYFYADVWPELARRLLQLPPVFDVFVTVPPDRAAQAVADVLPCFANARLCVTPNLGMDVLPFLSLVPTLVNEGYELVCKLHTKRGQGEQGEVWRDVMLDSLVGSGGNFVAAMEAMQADKQLHAIGPGPLYLSGAKLMYDNEQQLQEVLQTVYGQQLPDHEWGFFAGSMLWLRVEVLQKLAAAVTFKHPELDGQFKKDGKLEHALERVLGLLPTLNQGSVGVLLPKKNALTDCLVWRAPAKSQTVKAHIGDALFQLARIEQDHASIEQSGLFVNADYVAQIPELKASGVDCIYHYLIQGRYTNQSPSNDFELHAEASMYLRAKGDRRSPMMLWLEHRGDSQSLKNFLKAYTHPKPKVFDADFVRDTGLFDEIYYKRQFPEIEYEGVDALEHYLKVGNCAELFPCKFFIPREYRQLNPDVLEQDTEPFYHYLKVGALEGRRYRSKAFREQEESPFWRQMVLNKVMHRWHDLQARQTEAGKLSVVVVLSPSNPEGLQRLRLCMQALSRSQTRCQVQWVLVNNGIDPSSLAFVQQLPWKGDVTVVHNPDVFGLALARNIGFASATGQWLVFLSPWVELPLDGLDLMVQVLQKNTHVAVQPLLLQPNGQVWHAGFVYAIDQPLPYPLYKGIAVEDAAFNRDRVLQGVSGLCMATSADAFAAVGGFDPLFLGDLGDADLCMRLMQVSSTGCLALDGLRAKVELPNSMVPEVELKLDRLHFVDRWRKRLVADDYKNYAQDRWVIDGWQLDEPHRVEAGFGLSLPLLKRSAVRRLFYEWDHAAEVSIKNKLEQFYTTHNHEWLHRPLVSVIMPTFNRADVVGAAIESVLKQTMTNFELIVCDDGSTDGTENVVAGFNHDSRVVWHALDHAGVGAARNAGLNRARGEMIAYLDSDNTWEAGFLMWMVSALKMNAWDAAYAALEVSDDTGQALYYRGDSFDWEECLKENYVDMNAFVHQKTSLRFDEALPRLVDWDFVLRLTHGLEVGYVPVRGVFYYDGDRYARISKNMAMGEQLNLLQRRVRAKHNQLLHVSAVG